MSRRRASAGAAVAVLAALAGAGVLAVRGAASGAGPRVVAVGLAPGALAVDQAAGHVFVLNRNTDESGVPVGTGSVSMLDTRSGAVLRTTSVGFDPSTIAVDERTARVFVSNPTDNDVSMIDARTGALLRTITLRGALGGAEGVVVDEQTDRAFVVNLADGSVAVLDTRSGAILRNVHVAKANALNAAGAPIVAVDPRRDRVYIAGSSVPGYVGPGSGGLVSVLDGRSGRVLRAIMLVQDAGPLVVDQSSGRVDVFGYAGVAALDPRTGRQVGGASLRTWYVEPALDQRSGHMFALTINGNVAMLDARSGRLLRLERMGLPPGPVALAMDQRRGLLLLCTGGSLRVLEARRGAVLRTIPVAGCDGGLAVDEQAGHAYAVASGDTAAPAPDPWGWLPGWLRSRLPFAAPPRAQTVPGTVTVLDLSQL